MEVIRHWWSIATVHCLLLVLRRETIDWNCIHHLLRQYCAVLFRALEIKPQHDILQSWSTKLDLSVKASFSSITTLIFGWLGVSRYGYTQIFNAIIEP